MAIRLVAHPFLFASFPILFLFSYNARSRDLPLVQIALPLVMALGSTFVLWLLVTRLVGDKKKAGIVVSAFALLFLSWGRLATLARMGDRASGSLPDSVVALLNQGPALLAGVAIALGVVVLLRTRRSLVGVTSYLNVTGAILVAVPLVTGAYALVSNNGLAWAGQHPLPAAGEVGWRPDIYYIILDGYARSDVLLDLYGYDNSSFLEHLTQEGFYVADESRSNYSQTLLSFASALNFSYLDELASQIGEESGERAPLVGMIRDSDVVRFLKERGYLFVTYSTGIEDTEVRNSDMYLVPRRTPTEFQALLVQTTPIPDVQSLLSNLFGSQTVFDLGEASHRERVLATLQHLPDVAAIDAPTFVFAHIVAPHPPFLFGENGEEVTYSRGLGIEDGSHYHGGRTEYIEGYRDQAIFITQKVQETVDEILRRSPEPPIIVLQADHGPGSRLDWDDVARTDLRERMSILNAYYLPGSNVRQPYATITPVNTFRLILSQYFSAELPLLEDRSYFSTWDHPYDFIDVTDVAPGD